MVQLISFRPTICHDYEGWTSIVKDLKFNKLFIYAALTADFQNFLTLMNGISKIKIHRGIKVFPYGL